MSTIFAKNSEGNTPNFVGNLVDAINLGKPIKLPGGGVPRRDLLFVDDLSSACEAFADSVIRHGIYNIGGGHCNATTLSDLVKTMETVSGLQAVIDETDPLPMPVPRNYVTDLKRIKQELDWKPRFSISEGLSNLF
jgi:nucleoside-diphosphate-sugar epimerase